MTAEMRPLPFGRLLSWALIEHREQGSMLGVPASLFYSPRADRRFETCRPFGTRIGTPFGPAAGPHTQLAQNIVSAWLCGGRFVELKTVQVLDRLEIPRPCIAAADEGYNVEWSQELSLDESAREYAHAWALVHILPRALGFRSEDDAVLFNQSVGYTLDGVRSPAVQRFLDRMSDARELLDPVRRILSSSFSSLASAEIPDRISDSVTLSTMHGCPPDEIERIARHLLEDRGLHVTVKLNPTLLGKERVTEILHDRLGYTELDVPDDAFERDLRFDACLDLISALRSAADRCGRRFAVKLSNTLALRNPRSALPGDTVYMSGRALYSLTVTLFHELRRAVGYDLAVSYSAGADSASAPGLIAAGACPVTVATDLLKPGGYGRLRQYLDALEPAMDKAGAASVDAYAAEAQSALERVAEDALVNPRYRKEYALPDLPKLADSLPELDCIAAPCVATCPACQDVPVYAAHLADGDGDAALAAILARNPLPGITGHICTARCETRCTRANVDRPIRIRDLKRFAVERGRATLQPAPATGRRVAVVGAGPSGLAAAMFLALSGVHVTAFETQSRPGGMPAIAPAFRIPSSVVDSDVTRAVAAGVDVRSGTTAPPVEELLDEGFDAVYLACGFPVDAPLDGVPGLQADGVLGALDFLRHVAAGAAPRIGPRVCIIGGGNTAIDAARTALRLAAPVSVLYRRTRAELPADRDEVDDFLAEGGSLLELVSPVDAVSERGRLIGVECVRNHLGHPGPDGRRRPIPMPETRFRVPADTLILAIGQRPAHVFPASVLLTRGPSGEVVADAATGLTPVPQVYAGGDIVRGPSTIIEAAADGRKAAQAICSALGVPFQLPAVPAVRDPNARITRARQARARRLEAHQPLRLPVEERRGFALVTATLSESEARAEASRCLQCQLACDKCIDVCPNRANQSYATQPIEVRVPVLDLASGAVTAEETVRVAQSRQIVHIVDLCNECGNCSTFCVHDGKPFLDKPRLFLSRASFDEAEGPALFLASSALLGKDADGTSWRVEPTREGFRYSDAQLTVRLDLSLAVAETRLTAPGAGTHSSARAVTAAAVFRGLRESPARALVADVRGEA